MDKWLKYGRRELLGILTRDPCIKVSVSSIEDVKFYQEVIGAKFTICADVRASADKIKLLSEEPGGNIKQN